ncbi:DUF1016 N-terminal domain-containing protein [Paraflavitalea speifideaquila]|uniref:DUF1016 N-terminal domain-containing protein n=1 Tax=Paraflavitalea speifideaquila TaxID=3076558 RepID=UPI0028E95AB5|nr:DUF1016 N-terminal domain-containing protein [Paraflavitalea speifideiaquila]
MRDQLNWTHYRLLLKLEKEDARQFYITETIACKWNTRTLEKQINNLYYERMLLSGVDKRPAVRQEAESKKEAIQPRDIIKDPYLLNFLDLKPNHAFYEFELEEALINKLPPHRLISNK